MCPPSVVGPPLDLQRLEEENLRLKTVRFMIPSSCKVTVSITSQSLYRWAIL